MSGDATASGDEEQTAADAHPAERQRQRLTRRRSRAGARVSESDYDLALAKGIAGEEIVGRELERLLCHTEAVIAHSLQFLVWGDIDHLIIGPGGITVVDAKNWTGTVSVRAKVPYVESWNKRKEIEKLAGQCAGVRLALLHARPDLRSTAIRGIMCLASQPDRSPQTLTHDLLLCGSAGAAMIGARPGCLSSEDINHLRQTLVRHLPHVRRADVDELMNPAVRQSHVSSSRRAPVPAASGFATRRTGQRASRLRPRRRATRATGGRARRHSRLIAALALAISLAVVGHLRQPAVGHPSVSWLQLTQRDGRAVVSFTASQNHVVRLAVTINGERHAVRFLTNGGLHTWIGPSIRRGTPLPQVDACIIDTSNRCLSRDVRARFYG